MRILAIYIFGVLFAIVVAEGVAQYVTHTLAQATERL